MYSINCHSTLVWLKQVFRTCNSLCADRDCLIANLVRIRNVVHVLSCLHFSIVILSNKTKCFFDLFDFWIVFVLRRWEWITFNIDQVKKSFIQIYSCNWNLLNRMRNCITFINRDSMRNSISAINDCSCCFTWSVKREHSLDT